MKKVIYGRWFSRFCLLLITGLALPLDSLSSELSCFANVKYVTPQDLRANRALYIMVDETVPLSEPMKKKIEMLVEGWGQPGDQVKIARFSAGYRGLHPELVFSKRLDPLPDDNFMFNLHYMDKKKVTECMAMQQESFKVAFPKALKDSLQNIDPKIPKTELLGSLKLLSKQVVAPDDAKEKIVLLISDGIENSGVLSFYSNNLVKKIDVRKEIATLRRKGLLGYWKNTQVYMYGTGLMPDKKRYSNPDSIETLKRFWEQYFVEGGAKVREIGSPELLLTAID